MSIIAKAETTILPYIDPEYRKSEVRVLGILFALTSELRQAWRSVQALIARLKPLR